jgi:uncharacterized protein with ParB-like and HNH nuclease domain
MDAHAAPVLQIFEKKMRLEVPLFQRQYVWKRDTQWEPLWEDIARKFFDYLAGRKDAPVHFLGAMVLDQKQTPATHVEKRQVIDGQQRLTTLQIFLAAMRDFCSDRSCEELAKEVDAFILNRGMMTNPSDKFKVWPTKADQDQFSKVVTGGSRKEVENRFPLTKKKYARNPDPRPRMVEAYLFFYDSLRIFFEGTKDEAPVAVDVPLATRVEECLQALKNSLFVVAIDLQKDDDAQVIFETLNARGEPLLPADLLRNYIFLRAARNDEKQEELYEKYWKGFDDQFWRKEIKQGRLLRPRSDIFIQHFLSLQQFADIPIKHLFVEYKFWIEKKKPFASVEEELSVISRQAHHFRRIIEPGEGDCVESIARVLDIFDVRTAYPLILYLLDKNLSDEEFAKISSTIESYLVRRAVCGLTTQNYNRIFLGAIKHLSQSKVICEELNKYFSGLRGESTEWPRDDAFGEAWKTRHAYQTLSNPKLVHVLRRLNETYSTSKTEGIRITTPLTVEHLLPQNWIQFWKLPNDQTGLSGMDLLLASADDATAAATRYRNMLLQTIGNLTIVTQPLNSAASNADWAIKKNELKSSLLLINSELQGVNTWDEAAIKARSAALLARALNVWKSPIVKLAEAAE